MRGRFAAVALLALTAGSLLAQGGRRGQRPLPGGPPAGGPQRGGQMDPDRAQLEQQVRQRLGQVLRNQLGLNDEQMQKLQETNRRYDGRRRLLLDQERDIRMSFRDEMLRPDSGRDQLMNALLDRMVQVQRQRVDLLEQEQKDLSGFLTPMQRAKYWGLEENMRQRMQQMRQQQGRGGRGIPPDGDPGMGPPDPQGGQFPPRMRRRPPPPDTVPPPIVSRAP